MIINVAVTGKVIVEVGREEISIDVDEAELVRAIGDVEDVLSILDYDDIVRYVAEVEEDKADYAAELRGDDGKYIG